MSTPPDDAGRAVCYVCGESYPMDCVTVDDTHPERPYICFECDEEKNGPEEAMA